MKGNKSGRGRGRPKSTNKGKNKEGQLTSKTRSKNKTKEATPTQRRSADKDVESNERMMKTNSSAKNQKKESSAKRQKKDSTTNHKGNYVSSKRSNSLSPNRSGSKNKRNSKKLSPGRKSPRNEEERSSKKEESKNKRKTSNSPSAKKSKRKSSQPKKKLRAKKGIFICKFMPILGKSAKKKIKKEDKEFKKQQEEITNFYRDRLIVELEEGLPEDPLPNQLSVDEFNSKCRKLEEEILNSQHIINFKIIEPFLDLWRHVIPQSFQKPPDLEEILLDCIDVFKYNLSEENREEIIGKLREANPLEACTEVKFYGLKEKVLVDWEIEGKCAFYYLEVVWGEFMGYKEVRETCGGIVKVLAELVKEWQRGIFKKKYQK